MTYEDIVALGLAMRQAQKKWFNPKTRTAAVLKEALDLERRFDKAVEEYGDKQGTLFEGGDPE